MGFAEKTGLNNKDLFSVVKAPKNMQYVTNTLEKMERGELKVPLCVVLCLFALLWAPSRGLLKGGGCKGQGVGKGRLRAMARCNGAAAQ